MSYKLRMQKECKMANKTNKTRKDDRGIDLEGGKAHAQHKLEFEVRRRLE